MPKTYKITAEEVEIEKIGVHENTVSEWVCSFKKIGCCQYFKFMLVLFIDYLLLLIDIY